MNHNNEIKLIKKKLLSSIEINKYNKELKETKCARMTKNVKTNIILLYNEIIEAVLWTNEQINTQNIIFKVEEIEKIKDIPRPNNFNDHFYPDSLRNNMINNAELKISCDFKINNLNYKIILVSKLKEDFNTELKYLFDNIKCMISWLYVGYKYSKCAKTIKKLTIYFYKFEHLKQLPKKGVTISPINVNSAYSNVCNGNNYELDIVLFRSEEWFKVFVHETFHAYNLTISPFYGKLDKHLFNIFGLSIEYNIGEAYAEFWARIINICFLILNSQTKYNKNQFIIEFEKYLDLERVFSLFHAMKVLNHNNMIIKYFYKENKDNDMIILLKQQYIENTSVFSYYVIASILLINSSKMLEWCYNNNDIILQFKNNETDIINFISFIHKCLNTECVKNYIKNIDLWLNKDSNKNEKNGKTLRMSINEWIY